MFKAPGCAVASGKIRGHPSGRRRVAGATLTLGLMSYQTAKRDCFSYPSRILLSTVFAM